MFRRSLVGGLILLLLVGGGYWALTRASPKDRAYSGYVESETLFFAAPTSGTLAKLEVDRGERVPAGASLFQVDTGPADAMQAQADAAERIAETKLADARRGQRPQELDVIQAQKAAAEASLTQAKVHLDRVKALQLSGVASKATLDDATAAYATALANYSHVLRQIDVARLGARSDQIEAAKSGITQAKANAEETRLRVGQLSPKAPIAGLIEDVFYRPGEWVPANQPVVALLPDDRIKIRFYVPQAVVARYRPGRVVQVSCDGCGEPRTAVIRYVSPRVEFTPPVIYSRKSRDRLVFLVEASPQRPRGLAPGQPIDVQPLDP